MIVAVFLYSLYLAVSTLVGWLVGWLVGMLVVSRSGLVKEDAGRAGRGQGNFLSLVWEIILEGG